MSRASIDINCTRARAHKTGSIEQEIPAGKELSVMRNRADGTRKITRVRRVATCGKQIERVHLVQVLTDCKEVHTEKSCTSCQVALTVV